MKPMILILVFLVQYSFIATGLPLNEDLSDEVGVDPDTLDVEMGIYPTNGTGEDQNQGNLISPKPGTNSSTQTKGALLLSPGSALGASFWDGGIVHYRFATERRLALDAESKRMIRVAMNSIMRATHNCIRFVEDTAGTRETGVIIYQRFLDSTDQNGRVTYQAVCLSECLGQCNGKPNRVVVTPMQCEYVRGNYAGSAAHEIMHSLGFDHEFQRNDRDAYFYINERLYPNFYNRFNPLPDDTKNIPMNYKSIMNYDLDRAAVAYRNPPRRPIGTVRNFGQECRISAGDRNLIERTYAPLCRTNGLPRRIYRRDFRIAGTNCSFRIAADDNDVDV